MNWANKLLDTRLVCLALLLITAGCQRQTNTAHAEKADTLLISGGLEPEDLDPQTITGVSENNIASALYEGLVTKDPRDLHPVPGVAESWEISPDGLVYTFHLRKNARWSNGDPVTAQDFYDSYQRILNPALGSDNVGLHHFVRNAEAFATGKIKDFSQVGYRVVDPQTFVITLNSPTPFFLSIACSVPFYPVHIPTVKKFGGLARKAAFWTKPENCVTNGPFLLKDWKQQSIIRCVKNPGYWDAQTVRLQEIDFFPIDSADTEERAFRAGQLHITETVPLSKIAYYQKHSPQNIRIDPYMGTYFYCFNTKRPPFTDPKVRLALAMSIDRKLLVEKVARGGQKPAESFTPPGLAGYQAEAKIPYDVPRARKLLAEAGYPNGKGLPRIEILFNSSEAHRSIAEAIQEMWRKNLNVEVQLTNQEWKVYLNSMAVNNFQICREGWIGQYPDPEAFLGLWVGKGGYNYSGWADLEYDALDAQLQKASAASERLAIFQKMEARLMAEVPILPIYWYTSIRLVKPEIQGWYPNMFDDHPYKYVYFGQQKPGSTLAAGTGH